MAQPQGYTDPESHPMYVLCKSLFMDFVRHLELGMINLPLNCWTLTFYCLPWICLSLSNVTNGSITYLLLHVDDIIITGNNSIFITSFIHQMGQHFKMKDLGLLTYFLDMEAHRTNNGLFLFQTKYITDLLVKSDMVGCKPVGSSASKKKLSPSNGPLLDDPTQFRSIVGALQHVSLTRPNISYAVNQVC